MATPEGHERGKQQGRHFLIPAGLLIGLGVGLITGHAGPGILLGLGSGMLASTFVGFPATSPDIAVPCCDRRGRWPMAVIGIFLILFGIGIVWAPLSIWMYVWPYGIGAFFILLGLSFLMRMWRKTE